MTVANLIENHPAEWRSATTHAFLDGLRDGSLSEAAFTRWLVQDYLFVGDLLAFQARLLARAPRAAQRILVSGLVALEAELAWFEGQATAQGLSVQVAAHEVTRRYAELLVRLDRAPYAAAVTALWALERAYLDAWRGAAPGAPAYREFVEHWTAPAFDEYVAGLAQAADEALASASAEERAQAQQAFLQVARLERDFWSIADP